MWLRVPASRVPPVSTLPRVTPTPALAHILKLFYTSMEKPAWLERLFTLRTRVRGNKLVTNCPTGGRDSSSVSHYCQLPEVRLGEVAELLQGIVLRHRQPADVWSEQAKRDALQVRRGVGDGLWGVLQAEDHPQQVSDALGHIWKEQEEECFRMLHTTLRSGSLHASTAELSLWRGELQQ